MLPDTFEQWRNERKAGAEMESKRPVMGQKLEDTAKEAIVALETLKKHLDRLEEERTLYTAALLAVRGGLSKGAPKELLEAAEDMISVLDEPNPSGISLLNARDRLKAALDKVKS